MQTHTDAFAQQQMGGGKGWGWRVEEIAGERKEGTEDEGGQREAGVAPGTFRTLSFDPFAACKAERFPHTE